MSTVYIETSVPSAYVTTRTDPASVYRRLKTLEWWQQQLSLYEPWTSDGVILELETGNWEGKQEALVLMDPIPRIEIDEEVIAVAGRYIEERLMPRELGGDAVHMAVASVRQMDYLLTWNIRHLANPNKMDHLVVINRRLGLLTPRVVTPEMLWLE